MCIVTLKDGTQYYIDTNDEFNAREIVEYKLRQRLDFRQIISVQSLKGALLDKKSEYYNSENQWDGKDLKTPNGWAYKWD